MRASLSFPLLALLTACAQQPISTAQADCATLFGDWRNASAASRDAQYRHIEGVHGLRSSRREAALAAEVQTPEQRRLWLRRLANNDREASKVELANLPAEQRSPWSAASVQTQLAACRRQQQQDLLDDADAFERLRGASQVADDYSSWARTLGFYWLFKPFYKRGIAAWQAEAAQYQAPSDTPQWLSYRALPHDEVAIAPLQPDALGLPQADAQQRAALLARHAPHLRVEQGSQADRIGHPGFDDQGLRRFAPTEPQVFQRLDWSRIDGRWHLQLVYQFWFSERPKPHALDLFGGALDGLIWRVTLDPNGNALLYDAIHPCGCWHAFYLPAGSPWVFQQPAEQEARLARTLDIDGSSGATLWLNSDTHSLQWVDGRRSAYPAMLYSRQPLDRLRQLTHPQGSRSLYASDGLVPGSERLERWLLWPSGVSSPGAMRQWGRHATAFVGRAHFDDPDLLARYFHRP
jgi:hypothetical protein